MSQSVGYILISDEYRTVNSYLILKNVDGYLYYTSLDNIRTNIKRGSVLSLVDKGNPYSIENINLWCNINNKPFILISNKYINSKEKLIWKCTKENCNEEFKSDWDSIRSNRGCPYCCNPSKMVGLSNCLATKNPELAKEWHPTKNGSLTPFDVTFGNRKREIWWKCKVCNNEWTSNILNRNNNRSGCPECNQSKGEKRCKETFISRGFIEINQDNYNKLINDNNNTYFISQKEFDGLIGTRGGRLSYDFYLPKHRTLIEFQGEFHDGNGNYYMKQNLEKQKEHDRRKKEYAEQNGYNLLEIWYWDFDNIEEILRKELSKYNL